MSLKQQKSWDIETALMVLCMIVGIILRIGLPADFSFINDELSTWSKVSYDSVGEVIENIKLVDSHPVGMYVFVYYWTAIFGVSEWAIKFPFLLMSFASMFFVYRLATLWFSRTVGLFVLAFFASLQFPIWWSHIARQYQSGLFCTLVMAYCWTQLLLKEREDKKYWVGFVLMGAAAMYNHYFSLIFAGIIGLSGFIWVRKAILWKYLGAGIAMVLLFLPQVPLTQYQLEHADGHLWYNIPTPSFFSNHIYYLFHYSYWSLGLMAVLVIGSFFFYKRTTTYTKKRWTALLWFLTPMLFGYLYSVYKSPILRESHLLFSFPYLLFFLLSFFPEKMAAKTKIGLVLIILLVNVSTLIVTRKHYQTVHSHPYEHFITETKAFLLTHNSTDVSIVLGENPLYLQYYKDVYQANFEHKASFKAAIPFLEFKELLENSRTAYLIIGSLPEAHVQMAMDYYPYLYKKKEGINYEYYILAKEKLQKEVPWEIDYETVMTFDSVLQENWKIIPSGKMRGEEEKNSYYHLTWEWGPIFEANFSVITPRENQFLDIALDLRVADSIPTQPNGTLVLEIRDQQDSLLVWKAVNAVGQTTVKRGWQRIYLSVRLAHEVVYGRVKGLKMKTFFWNREEQAVQLDRFRIRSRKGNQLLYGDTNNFK